MSVASTGAGAGAEQLSLEKPHFCYKFAPRLATLIEGNHFFLTPVRRFVAFTENDKLCFCLLSSLPATGHRRERLLLPK